MNEWMNQWMSEWMSEWVNEWVNESMNESMNEWLYLKLGRESVSKVWNNGIHFLSTDSTLLDS